MKIEQRIKMSRITIRERNPITAGLRRQFNAASKAAWQDTAEHFEDQMLAARFTPEHAREAGYSRRKGETLPVGSKGFRRSYYGRKYYAADRGGGANRADPLVDTGESKRSILGGGRIETTKNGVTISYAAARGFNRRHEKSRIKMNEEFRTITRREVNQLASRYDASLDRLLK